MADSTLPNLSELAETPQNDDELYIVDKSDTTDGATGTNKKIQRSNLVGGLLANVVEDTTPQLGGDLDVNGNSIVSASAGNIAITPDTTGSVVIDGLSHPQADGSAGQFIKTDGAGALSFTDAGGGSMARVAGSTYSTIQHMQDIFHSVGVTTGGGITDDTDGTITVATGTGLIRATDSVTAQMLWTDWAAESGANVALTDNDMNYIYVEYNAGSPRVIATITERTDENTNILLGTVYRSGTTLHITSETRPLVGDHALRMINRLKETLPFVRASGGTLGESGTRNISVSAGTWWIGLSTFTTSAFDSSVASTFSYFYRDGGGGWTEATAQTQIDNTQYDNGTGTLATLSNNKYGDHWVYIDTEGNISVVYGTGDYTLQEAQEAGAPASVPPHFEESHDKLIGKIIILKSAASFTAVISAFDTVLSGSAAADHGDLSGLGDDDHSQYSLISSQAGAPSSTPSRVGEINIDTTNDKVYVSTDTASSADWDLMASTIDDLADVDTDKSKTPADGDVLTYDGTDWNAEAAAGGSSTPKYRFITMDYGTQASTDAGGTTDPSSANGGSFSFAAARGWNLTTSTSAAGAGHVRATPNHLANLIETSLFDQNPIWYGVIATILDGDGYAWWGMTGEANSHVTIPDTTTTKKAGFYVDVASTPTVTYYALVHDGTTETKTDITSTLTAVTDYKNNSFDGFLHYLVEMSSATSIKFYCEGTLLTTVSSNLPTGGVTDIKYNGQCSVVNDNPGGTTDQDIVVQQSITEYDAY